jgi:DNA invertase Pin-like site-specific DNA recombinase
MIAAVAEMERGLLSARTKDGIAAARARGRFGGRPPKLSQTQKEQIRKLYNARELTVKEIAGLFQISSPSVYRALETS